MPLNESQTKQKECPGCAMMIDAKEEVCPICGYEFPHSSLMLKISAAILVIALILYLVL